MAALDLYSQDARSSRTASTTWQGQTNLPGQSGETAIAGTENPVVGDQAIPAGQNIPAPAGALPPSPTQGEVGMGSSGAPHEPSITALMSGPRPASPGLMRGADGSAEFTAHARAAFAARVRRDFWDMKRFRNTHLRFDDRCAYCLRAREGQYDATTRAEICEYGGSDVYARLTSNKSRGAKALLEEIFLASERPWKFDPSPVPTQLQTMLQDAQQLVKLEAQKVQMSGAVPPGQEAAFEQLVIDRMSKLYDSVARAARQDAREKAAATTLYVDDILVEGGFYQALREFINDFVTFPAAVMKGPVVRMKRTVTWQQGTPRVAYEPVLHWETIRPYRLWWTPGGFDVERCDFVEVSPQTRADLQALIGVPGFDQMAIRRAMSEYRGGLREWHYEDNELSRLEGRHDNVGGQYEFIDRIESTCRVQGIDLLDMGIQVDDPYSDYLTRSWMVGNHVLKIQVDSDPWQMSPYSIASYEPTTGSLIGNALPEIMGDIQEVANATLRAWVNNLSVASGPQVVVNDAVIANPEGGDKIRPWKVWHVEYDPSQVGSTSQRPIDFFQPQSNVQDLHLTFQSLMALADEVTSLPRYMTGGSKASGAAQTASGLAQLTGNSARTVKSVAGEIDTKVLERQIKKLHSMVMLQNSQQVEFLQGDENLVVEGATKAEKIERDRMRKLELLQITGNPIDMAIMGVEGRARAIKSIARDMGVEHEDFVPTMEEVQQRLQAMQANPGTSASTGQPAPAPKGATKDGQERVSQEQDNQQRTRNMGGSRGGADQRPKPIQTNPSG